MFLQYNSTVCFSQLWYWFPNCYYCHATFVGVIWKYGGSPIQRKLPKLLYYQKDIETAKKLTEAG